MNALPSAEIKKQEKEKQEIRAEDAKARIMAQAVFDRPVVVEAGAGTGKTSALVARVATWCLGPGWIKKSSSDEGQDSTPEAIAARVMQGVTAMTFTEAAASEMAQRVGQAFSALEKGESLPLGIDADALDKAMSEGMSKGETADLPAVRIERARCLLLAIDRLRACTIHSFCKRLLDEHPLEAGWHPAYQIDAQGLEIERVVREVLEEALKASIQREDSAFLRLADHGIEPQSVEQELLQFVKQRVPAEAFQEAPLSHPRVVHATEALSHALENLGQIAEPHLSGVKAGKAKVVAALIEPTREQLQHLTTAAQASEESWSPDTFFDLRDWLSDNWKALENKLNQWRAGKFSQGESDALGGETDGLREAATDFLIHLDSWASFEPAVLSDLCEVMAEGLSVCHDRLRAQGIASFESLIWGARDLLVQNNEVAGRVRSGIDQLLVDEFQDTNPAQCDLLRAIALTGDVDRRPGLFLVGDPKQSIYSWRQADLAAYDRFIEELSDAGDPRVRLAVNFRSSEDVLEEVARVIRPVMVEEYGLQPAFVPLLPKESASQEAQEPIACGVEYWVPWQWDSGASAPVSQLTQPELDPLEARWLANSMQTLHCEKSVPWCEMGVLTRSNDQGAEVVRALRAAGIPYVIEQDRTFYQRREIIDAAAFVRVVLDPSDNLALLTWLRSSCVGVPDAALIPLWKEAFPKRTRAFLLAEPMESASDQNGRELGSPALSEALAAVDRAVIEMPEDVPGLERMQSWDKGLRFGLLALAQLRRSYLVDSFDDFLEMLPRIFLLQATEGARYPGTHRVANLERFFRELRDLYISLDGNVSQLLRQLRSDLAGGRQAEATRPRAGVSDSVSVMTIHKSKGLEFEAVFLPGLHRQSKGDDKKDSRAEKVSVTGRSESEDQDLQWEWRLLGRSTLGFGEVLRKEKEKSSVERVRLLYVAMTRAKKHLVLSGKWKEEAVPIPPTRARSFLDLVASREADVPDLNLMMIDLQKQGQSRREQADTSWCFPSLSPELNAKSKQDVSNLPSLCIEKELEAARAAESLRQERRAQARKRMLREFAGSPSGLAPTRIERLEKASQTDEKQSRSSWAATVGTAIHAALEAFEFPLDPQEAWARQSDGLANRLQASLPSTQIPEALEAANSLWEGFREGPLFPLFLEAGKSECVRELDVLIPVDSEEENGPVAVYSGSIDLLYKDASGEVVVVDYKTDAVGDAKQVQERAASYLEQGRLYQRAVREALGLEKDPRFELWFLRPGIVWSLDSAL